jgi:hypothetical protein
MWGIDRLLKGGQQVTTPNLGVLNTVMSAILVTLLIALVGGLFGLALTNLGRKGNRAENLWIYGLIGGAVLWILFLFMVDYLGYPPAGMLGSIIGLGVLTLLWGFFLGWTIRFTLFAAPEVEKTNLSRRRLLYATGAVVAALAAGD